MADTLGRVGPLNTAKRETVPQVCLHGRPITSLALTADGRHFFTAAGDGAVFMCKIQVRRWEHCIEAIALISPG